MVCQRGRHNRQEFADFSRSRAWDQPTRGGSKLDAIARTNITQGGPDVRTNSQLGPAEHGHINRALITPLRASPRNGLAAVATRDLAHAQAYADEWDIPHAFGSYEAMLADPDIDVVYVSLPNSLHAEWTIKAVQAGKHVLCEKPLAVTLAEVDAMTAAARSTGRVLAEASCTATTRRRSR